MDGSPSKRLPTETTLDSRCVVDASTRNDGVSEELRALLRNRAARVRKSVMEGYSTDRAELLQDERADLGGGVAETAQIFQSSRDINRRVLRHWTPSPFSSPKKRSRYDYEVEEALEEEGEGEEMEIDHLVANLQSLAEGISHRPMKPLRRTLFTDTSKPIIPQNHNMCTNHDGPCSGNPFLE